MLFRSLGPFLGVCSCLGNIGGCYIDAARPPAEGFTCTCVKQQGGNCTGLGYKLACGERRTSFGRGDPDAYNLGHCQRGAKLLKVLEPDCGGYQAEFTEQTWAKIQKDVKIRLFAPNSFQLVEQNNRSDGLCGVWEQGEDIYCQLSGGTWGDPHVQLPFGTSFNPRLPVKGVIHGFGVDATFSTPVVQAYHNKYNGEVNTILVDWSPLARPDPSEGNIYIEAARNSALVGEYLGRCLAALSKAHNLEGGNIHFTGHGMGGQMLGTVGRTYNRWTRRLTGQEDSIGRFTGLDPAGPGFVDGDIAADPRLTSARLKRTSAAFVDVIHTNAAKSRPRVYHPSSMTLGDYLTYGDIDFYPDGGELQTGCNDSGLEDVDRLACSHYRAFYYFVDTINSKPITLEKAECEFLGPDPLKLCMGEPAEESVILGSGWTEPDWNPDYHRRRHSAARGRLHDLEGGHPRQRLGYDEREKLKTVELSTNTWYQKHRNSRVEFTRRFACQAFSNIFTDLLDTSVCTMDHAFSCQEKKEMENY